MLFLIRHHDWDSKSVHSTYTSPIVHCCLRSMELVTKLSFVDWILPSHNTICSRPNVLSCAILSTNKCFQCSVRRFSNLSTDELSDRWCEQAIRENEIGVACELHAHLAFLFYHLPYEELTRSIVSTILSSQIFLTTRYRYDIAAEQGMKINRLDKERGPESGLGIPDTEMFDLFQRTRPLLMRWLESDPKEVRCM